MARCLNIERVIPMRRQRHASMHHARLIRQIAVAERRPAALDIRTAFSMPLPPSL
jgi:hypothetical protein